MTEAKGVQVVSLAGSLDYSCVPSLRERLNRTMTVGKHTLILNLEGVTYVDSAALALFISMNRKLRGKGDQFLLLNAPDFVRYALAKARVAEFIPVIGKVDSDSDLLKTPETVALVASKTMVVNRTTCHLEEVRHKVNDLFGTLGLEKKTVFDLVLALGEALGNAFDHGAAKEGCPDEIRVDVKVFRDRVVMDVCDKGCGCAFHKGDQLPSPTESRGRGIRLMVMLVDAVDIGPAGEGGGTHVRLVKLL